MKWKIESERKKMKETEREREGYQEKKIGATVTSIYYFETDIF